MDIDRLVEHLTDPSTIRGICWTIGCGLSLAWIAEGDLKGALEVISMAGLAAGVVGAVLPERRSRRRTINNPGGQGEPSQP